MSFKISKTLHRDFPVCKLKGSFLQLSLECYPAQRALIRKIFFCDRHNDRCIGDTASSVMIAHAIDRQTSLFTGSIDHIAARAHTEGINASSVFRLRCQLIAGCPKSLSARFILFSVLAFIDLLLKMLHTVTNRKILWLHCKRGLCQHLKCIPCAVPDRQYNMI